MLKCPGGGGGGGGGGGTWVFMGAHTFVIKIKKYPYKALISGQKSTLILIKTLTFSTK